MTYPKRSTECGHNSTGVRSVRESKVRKGHACMHFTGASAAAAQPLWAARYRRTEISDLVLRQIERGERGARSMKGSGYHLLSLISYYKPIPRVIQACFLHNGKHSCPWGGRDREMGSGDGAESLPAVRKNKKKRIDRSPAGWYSCDK